MKACLLLARFALATVLAVALVALAVYAVGERVKERLGSNRLQPERGDRL